MADKVKPVNIVRTESGDSSTTSDLLVVEEPLEIRVGYGPEKERLQHSLTVTMRTPGDDEHLCLGFLFTEGVITSKDQVLSAKYCSNITVNDGGNNVMRVELKPEVAYNPANYNRNFYTNSSCGVCGKASIEQVQVNCGPVSGHVKVNRDLVSTLPGMLLNSQDVFKHTGGVHACGLFNPQGQLMVQKEDVGRHNALDKLVGTLLLADQLPDVGNILMLSGRISFELVQKAVKAGIAVIAAVGAPSSLAVELANEFGVTLIGFLKESGFNTYTHTERIVD
jgi:FdhD protein